MNSSPSPSPQEPLVCRTRLICVLLTFTVFPLLAFGPLTGSLAALYYTGFSWKAWLLVGLFLFLAGYMSKHMLENFHWVELDGNTLRGKKLVSRRLVEVPVGEIIKVAPLRAVVNNSTNLIVDRVLGSSIRGFEIRTASGEKFGLVRYDMKGFDEFILALHDLRSECFGFDSSATR
ncbi:MAG: hypothetical protein SGJ19_05980 [Planctomycetia bacterium]|nr:hypothetical protein [Planctomycetia bacterium]